MGILTPILVTLAVTCAAVALAVRDAAGLRARADAWSWSWASGLVPSGWHPRWSWPGTGRPCGPAVRVVSVEARDLSGDVPAASLPRPAAALPASLSVAPVVLDRSGDVVHVLTDVPASRYGRTVPVTTWVPPAGLDWLPITRCEREPYIGGQCHRCTLRRGHPGDCVPGGAS